MSNSNRSVDIAMEENRPEKQTIRNLWLQKVKAIAETYPDSDIPWYLTLPGSKGYDLQLLIDEGLIKLTEVNAIAEESQSHIVAVEKDNEAVLELQKKFAGLTIKDTPFQNLIKGDGVFAWPGKREKKYCRARIINLDLNSILQCNEENGTLKFPIVEWVKKLCHIHADPPKVNWTLCLTLNSEINWPQLATTFLLNFLNENFEREPNFANACRDFLEKELFDYVLHDTDKEFNIGHLDYNAKQKILMVFVPKYISNLVHTEGWKIVTEHNLRYGGNDNTAPMVSWIINFELVPDKTFLPDKIYKESLNTILQKKGFINKNGEISF